MNMRFEDVGVVITGGGGGVGAALARALSAEGARVVVADLNEHDAHAVAAQVNGTPIVCDVASADGVRRLIAEARSVLGEIDLYCANAGIPGSGGPDADEEEWARSWEVHVMAHVRAARELLPCWLERGRGHFVATVSAAGLLTNLGAAPYSVSKHGSLAFAEWLSATYRHRGVVVQAICPEGVRTRMLDQAGHGGKVLRGTLVIDPEQLAATALDGFRTGQFLILPHPEVGAYYVARATDPDRWLEGMNKLQRRIELS
jgi:NAD(P)-dependent dehydrogenase (short-subunit alcohol dehydrogenase family)